MNVQTKSAPGLESEMLAMGRAARQSAAVLREASTEVKNKALTAAADALRVRALDIVGENAIDMQAAIAAGASSAMLDRLMLTVKAVEKIATGLEEVAALPDPVGRELARWRRPNGLDIARVATPIGVLGIIYESRPNVTADAGALCLKSGNAVILRGGSESLHSSRAIHAALVQGLEDADLPGAAIQLVPSTDRGAVGHMLKGLNGAIDLIVPRGGKSLVARVQEEARVPVLAHLEGICHVYIHAAAERRMAHDIAINSKLRRTGVCGAAETLLIDRSVLGDHGAWVLKDLHLAG